MKLYFLTGLLVCLGTPLLADFRICNETDTQAFAAIGYKEGDQWVSEGWWTIEPEHCSTQIVGDLTNRFYYILAKSTSGSWTGEYTFCYTDDEFKIIGDTDCTARGFKTGGFLKVDTGGNDVRDWTQNLSD